MKYSLIIRPEAEADLEEAKAWYDRQRPGLGSDFLLCVEQALDRVIRNPHWYAVLHRDVHRAVVRRFPYGIFYRVAGERVIVLGVFHGRRDPRRWKSRV